jgi:hypothetical protein
MILCVIMDIYIKIFDQNFRENIQNLTYSISNLIYCDKKIAASTNSPLYSYLILNQSTLCRLCPIRTFLVCI